MCQLHDGVHAVAIEDGHDLVQEASAAGRVAVGFTDEVEANTKDGLADEGNRDVDQLVAELNVLASL